MSNGSKNKNDLLLAACVVFLLVVIEGCDEVPQQLTQPSPVVKVVLPPPQMPTIKVEIFDTSKEVELRVLYVNHFQNEKYYDYAILKTIEDLKAYRKEVDFLVQQLDEVEKRMKTHEQIESK